MAGRIGPSAALTLLLGAALAPPVSGADEGVTTLPEGAFAAATTDLDGDGSREIVRLTDREGPGISVVAWGWADGAWGPTGEISIVPQLVDFLESPSPSEDAAALLTWHRDGSERLVVVSGAFGASDFSQVCCLSFDEVRPSAEGIELVNLGTDPGGWVNTVQAVDLDGDGTDEILTLGTRFDENGEQGTFEVNVLRVAGSGMERVFELEQPDEGWSIGVGDTDGVRGDDVVIGPDQFGEIVRLSWVDGTVEAATSHADIGEQGGWLAGIANGTLYVQTGRGLVPMSWAPDGSVVATGSTIGSLASAATTVLGNGADAVLLAQDWSSALGFAPSSMTVYDLDGDRLADVDLDESMGRTWEFIDRLGRNGFSTDDRPLWPWAGPMPVSAGEPPAFAGYGVFVQLDGDGGIETAPISPFIGATPVGLAGPDDAWMVLANGYFGPTGSQSYLFPGPPSTGGLSIVPRASLVGSSAGEADSSLEDVTLSLYGAVELSRTHDLIRIAAAADGFDVLVTGPPGADVFTIDPRASAANNRGSGGLPHMIEFRPRRNAPDNKNLPFERDLMILAADGRARLVRVVGEYVREAPTIDATAETTTFALGATLVGSAAPDTTILVDGTTVPHDGFGNFHVTVDASIWPRDVVVTARDVLGNETTKRIEVVGFIDYRGWPWLPITGLATMLAAAFLFVRTPARRAPPQPVLAGDATFEEIDGDMR